MKKSGCVIIALFLAVCASMFVNLLLFAALVGLKGSANVAAVKALRERDFEEVLVKEGTNARSEDCRDSARGHHRPRSRRSAWRRRGARVQERACPGAGDAQVKAVVISVDSPGR